MTKTISYCGSISALISLVFMSGCYKSIVRSDFKVKERMTYVEGGQGVWQVKGTLVAHHDKTYHNALLPLHSGQAGGEWLTIELDSVREGATYPVPSRSAKATYKEGELDNSTKGDCRGTLSVTRCFPEELVLRLDLDITVPNSGGKRVHGSISFERYPSTDAVDDYNEALKGGKENPDLLFGRAVLYRKFGYVTHALAEFKRALDAAPQAWSHRAEAERHVSELSKEP